jgi:virginiamycin A acetyltransferase
MSHENTALLFLKNVLRRLAVATAVLLTSPLWLSTRIAGRLRKSDSVFVTCSQIIGAIPSGVGVYLRRGFYLMTLDQTAADVTVEFATWFSHPQIRIGKHVYIGGRCIIGMCEIGDGVLIGSNVNILSGRHQHHSEDPNLPRDAQGRRFTEPHIGCKAWIGNSAVVMADVGDNSIIGAGSVVVKPIPPGSVAVGNPAVVKKQVDARPSGCDNASKNSPT